MFNKKNIYVISTASVFRASEDVQIVLSTPDKRKISLITIADEHAEMQKQNEELETKINELTRIVAEQNEMIQALWFNPGPMGPGAAEASNEFSKDVLQLGSK